MLPGNAVIRNRRQGPSLSRGMARIETVMSDSALKFKKLPTRAKICLVFSLVLSIVFYILIAKAIFKTNELTEEEFLETTKCPACYGSSACFVFFHDLVRFTGWSQFRFLDFVNIKNVHFGVHDNRDVVLKKLAHDNEIQQVDDWICENANRPKGCDVARVFHLTTFAHSFQQQALDPKLLKDLKGDMFRCGSFRLLDLAWKKNKEKTPNHRISFEDKLKFVYTLKINSEPILLQTFPSSEGWPFPEYLGSCGRFTLVENAGRPLTEFVNAPFQKRADIAYQIMKIAEQLTNNQEEFALYWTDLGLENLAVDPAGKVRVIDLENIFVVDKMTVQIKKPKGWDEALESVFDDCDGKNCLTFSTDSLCSHVMADHNYYAVCRNILSQYANDNNLSGGFLHDMPEIARDHWDLPHLLNECTHPTSPLGRFKVKERLIEALDNLRNYSPPGVVPEKISMDDDAAGNPELARQ